MVLLKENDINRISNFFCPLSAELNHKTEKFFERWEIKNIRILINIRYSLKCIQIRRKETDNLLCVFEMVVTDEGRTSGRRSY